jgi:hypothetical protein
MRENAPKTWFVPAISVVFFVTLACNVLAPIPAPTPSPFTPTPTPVPISRQVTLIPASFNETNQTPPYTITSQTPQLAGSDDPRVQAFNQRLNELVQKEVELHRQGFLQNPVPPISNGSSLDVTYKLVSQNGDIWSLKLDFSFYSDGAAHPGLYSITVNYDLSQGRELALGELFLPNTDYLGVVSKYCINELSKQPGFEGSGFEQGANPILENYRNWNLTAEGLLITFDVYQVAPYASGPQTVMVPFSELKPFIDPQGPLGGNIQ